MYFILICTQFCLYQTKIILICRNSSLRVFKFQYHTLLISGIASSLIFQDPARPVFVCRGFFPRLSRSFLFLSLPVRGILPRQLLYPRYDCSSPRRSSFAGLVQGIPIAEFHTSSGERWRWKVPIRVLSCVLFA